jgi:hypothetical protein
MKYFRLLILGIFFIFLFQYFFYEKSVGIIYIISKVFFSIFSLLAFVILVLKGLNKSSFMPFHIFFGLILCAIFGAYYSFNQGPLDTIIAENKLFPLLYCYSVILIFQILKPTVHELQKVFIVLGIITLLCQLIFNIFYPPELFYNPDIEDGFVKNNLEKGGFFYNFNSTFSFIAGFICLRNFLNNKKIIYLLFVICLVLVQMVFEKNRIEFVSLVAIFLMIIYRSKIISIKFILPIIILISIPYMIENFILYKNLFSFDINQSASFLIRSQSVLIVLNEINASILSLFWGNGMLNPLLGTSLQDKFGEHFWPADIGWLGTIFEFGVIGVFLIVRFIKKSLSLNNRVAVYYNNNTLFIAMKDFIFLSLLMSIISIKFIFLCGVYSTIFGIGVYYTKFRKR